MYLWPYDIPQFVNGEYLLVNAVILYWKRNTKLELGKKFSCKVDFVHDL